jgi:hypothetical protein
VALDQVFPSEPVRLIKCDVEGGEMMVFQGATRIIERSHPVVFCELVDGFLARYGSSLATAIRFFTDRGYEAHRAEGTSLHPPGVDGNYLFTWGDPLADLPAPGY